MSPTADHMSKTAEPHPVQRRRVFFIPGYDPHPARRYRELYRKEARAQAARSGYRIAVRAADTPRYGWDVAAIMEGRRVRARVTMLEWSDIVRRTMDHSVGGTYLQLLKVARAYLGSGAFRRMMWLRKGPLIAGLYPVVVLLAQLALAAFAGWLLGRAVAWGAAAALDSVLPGMAWGWLGALAGLPLAIWLLRAFRARDRRLMAHYLMHDLAYTAKAGGAYPPELEERLDAFSRDVASALAGNADEVLVVGHSSGAHLAISVVADLVRSGRVPANGPALGLLTLGHVVPMVSFLPRARRLRRDLNLLAASDRIAWVDVSAPGDGCCFALCDPVAVSGVAPKGQKWPLVLSAAFSRTLSPERMKHLRWRFFRLHFQYLCAFDDATGYDYFRITAGPLTLKARFAGRKPSMNRIDVPASRHISMAA